MKSAVIIGGGPAGCQCALWLNLLGHESIIIEASNRLGGALIYGNDLDAGVVGMMNLTSHGIADQMHQHILSKQIPVLFETEVESIEKTSSFFTVKTKTQIIQSHTIVIATGTRFSDGGFPEKGEIIIGHGFAYSSFDFNDKKVAILGGGTNALMSYVSAMKRGAASCHVYARTIKANRNRIAKVDPSDLRKGPYLVDADQMLVGSEKYDVIVVMYGYTPNFPKALDNWKKEIVRENQSIITDEFCQTPVSGIFSIGDVTKRAYPCLATAVADGTIAAKAIQKVVESRMFMDES